MSGLSLYFRTTKKGVKKAKEENEEASVADELVDLSADIDEPEGEVSTTLCPPL